jgi:hypothetical protein
MPTRLRKLSLPALALLAALLLGACGDSHSKVSTGTYAGESGASAPYLDVGPLTYQVQLSRQLNPANSEDAGYLQGLPPGKRKLGPGQEWFAVFLQVFNHTAREHPAATNITISDTQNNVYYPVPLLATNPYAYLGGYVPAASQLPPLDTTAAFGPTQGLLVLFKIYIVSLDNRPLEVRIRSPENLAASASAELDV